MSDIVAELSSGSVRRAVNRTTAPFRGYGMERLPGLRATYNWLYSRLVPDGEGIIPIDGIDLAVDFDDRSIVPSLWLTRRYEATFSRALDSLVGQSSRVVDVGAHVGYYTARFANLGAEVVAFEPCSSNRLLLERTLGANALVNQVQLVAAAACDRTGAATLWLGGSNTGAASLSPLCVMQPARTEVVSLTTLDQECRRFVPTLLKVDVQGAEAAVLRGGRDVIEGCLPDIGLEYNSAQIEASGDDPKSALGYLDALDYRLYLADEHEGVVRRMDSTSIDVWCRHEKDDGTGFANIIARHPSRDTWS